MSSLQVFSRENQWIVEVIENGVSTERSFDQEQHARSWAEGQTERLRRNEDPQLVANLPS